MAPAVSLKSNSFGLAALALDASRSSSSPQKSHPSFAPPAPAHGAAWGNVAMTSNSHSSAPGLMSYADVAAGDGGDGGDGGRADQKFAQLPQQQPHQQQSGNGQGQSFDENGYNTPSQQPFPDIVPPEDEDFDQDHQIDIASSPLNAQKDSAADHPWASSEMVTENGKAGPGRDNADAISDYTYDTTVDEYDVARLMPALPRNMTMQLMKESEAYGTLPPIAEKLVDECPRVPENEGLYVPLPPPVSEANVQRLRARLIREDMDRERLFDEDGRFHGWGDMLLPTSQRPFIHGHPEHLREHSRAFSTMVRTPAPYIGKEKWYALAISIKSVQFADHPLFTPEDVLCMRIRDLYQEYQRRKTIGLVQHYEDRILALQYEAAEVRRALYAAEDRHADRTQINAIASQLVTILENTIDSRKHRDREESEVESNFKAMYSEWTKLRQWRQQRTQHLQRMGIFPRAESKSTTSGMPNQYCGRPLRLKVQRRQTDLAQEASLMARAERDEIQEHEELFHLQMAYPHIRLSSITLREAKNTEQFPQESIAIAVRKRLQSTRRQPGQPVYTPVLLASESTVSSEVFCDDDEKTRRNNIRNEKIQARILVDDKVVTSSVAVPLEFPAFSCEIGETFNLQLLHCPKNIKFQLFVAGFVSDSLLAEVVIPVPDYSAAAGMERVEFGGIQVKPSMSRVALGFEPAGDGDEAIRFVSGYLEAMVAWDRSKSRVGDITGHLLDQAGLHGPQPNVQPGNDDDPESKWNMAQQRRLMAAMRSSKDELDPNDPRAAALIEQMRKAQLDQARGRVFRTTRVQPELQLVENALYVESARRKVLRVRKQTRAIHGAVPIDDLEIPERMYEAVETDEQASLLDEKKGAHPDDVTVDPSHIRIQQQWSAKKKLAGLRQEINDVRELVKEIETPEINFGLGLIAEFLAPRRKLHIERAPLKTIANPSSCNVVMQLIRGENFPVRRPDSMFSHGSSNEAENDSKLPEYSRPFVEVAFQGNTVRSDVSRGTNPHWHQLLSMPFRPKKGGYVPSELQQVTDCLYINIFDEVTRTYEEDHRLRNTRIQQKERRWLGRVTVPFTTIYMNGRVEGMFTIEVPVSNLGYATPLPDQPTLLWLYLTLDPVLARPPQRLDVAQWRHRSPFYAHCVDWMQRLVEKFPHTKDRNLVTLAGDINGQPRIVCNYVCPQAPPDDCLDPNEFARFVSMIPFVDDWQQSEGNDDVWCTSSEFLTLSAGDWEEHALLLCNYFKDYELRMQAQGWHTYVLLGHGIPEGSTAYVLRLHEIDDIIDEILLWNPVTGRSYDLQRNPKNCPLVSVGCVFDENDVWANVQEAHAPARINYYFANRKFWIPLFTLDFDRNTVLAHTMQQEIQYMNIQSDYYQDRARRIERIIERRFEKWRRLPTRWNYGACQTLRQQLMYLEFAKQGKTVDTNDKYLTRLRQAYVNMHGFSVNMADAGDDEFIANSDENPIVRAVKDTCLHEVEDHSATFALGVHIEPYANHISSVWVYVATLVE
jgi:coiled-coil and C2 domain-containing protein 2A